MTDATFPFWLPFAFIGLWLLVGAVLSEIARWPELAARWPGGEEPPGRMLHGVVLSVGIVRETNATVLTASNAGLYMRASMLFRFRRPPILVPWSEVVYVRERRFLWWRSHVLELGGVTRIEVTDRAISVMQSFLVGAPSAEARLVSAGR